MPCIFGRRSGEASCGQCGLYSWWGNLAGYQTAGTPWLISGSFALKQKKENNELRAEVLNEGKGFFSFHWKGGGKSNSLSQVQQVTETLNFFLISWSLAFTKSTFRTDRNLKTKKSRTTSPVTDKGLREMSGRISVWGLTLKWQTLDSFLVPVEPGFVSFHIKSSSLHCPKKHQCATLIQFGWHVCLCGRIAGKRSNKEWHRK